MAGKQSRTGDPLRKQPDLAICPHCGRVFAMVPRGVCPHCGYPLNVVLAQPLAPRSPSPWCVVGAKDIHVRVGSPPDSQV